MQSGAQSHPGNPDAVKAVCDRIRRFTHHTVQSDWRLYEGELPPAVAIQPLSWGDWSPVTLNTRDHIAWPQGRQVIWLGQVFTLPKTLQNYPLTGYRLRLSLVWWAEQADIYVQRQLAQVGDLYDCFARVLLTDQVTPGHAIAVAIRLVSPGHDPGALVKSQLVFEPTQPDHLDPGMLADELEVLSVYVQAFAPAQVPELQTAIAPPEWQHCVDHEQYQQHLCDLRTRLLPWQGLMQERHMGWVGHAHLDMAWLWPVAETWEVAERTFQSVLALQADFPELIFCHSSPALYAWLEVNRPQLFTEIQAQVAAGRWEIAAGLWIEPELNLISGESLVRQVLYGQRYTQAKFGVLSTTAWLPDSFGFCWQLPQILKQGGIDYFVTQKLRWNDTTTFPHEVFWWQAPDGTQILAVMLPPIGKGIEPVAMGNYAQTWETATGCPTAMWLPGVGDHGGGPTRDMLELARKWQHSPLFPQLQPMSAAAICRQIEAEANNIPVWTDELYLEYHRGCYTSHADQKWFNRTCETLLVEAEVMSAIATLTTGTPYPKTALEQAWKQVLFNQFHDILPGSAIPEVFVDADREWQAAQHTASECLQGAMGAIAAAIAYPPPPTPASRPIIVFNPLNWSRTSLIRQDLPAGQWQILDLEGRPVPCQWLGEHTWLFTATDLPAVGYRVYWLTPVPTAPVLMPAPETWILENTALRVEINPETGEIRRLFDKLAAREVLAGPGNQLQFFTDQGQYWDAWNIDPDYASHPRPGASLDAIEWIAWGPLEQRIRVTLSHDTSTFWQDYILEQDSPILKIATQVDWQTRQVLVKTAFPLTVTAATATYEIPCGVIERPTLPHPHPLPAAQTAKWEVPALQWADLSQADYGVSLLNDCKHGYDAQPNQLRLTLLRGPNWPDPDCDRGQHTFAYALYPHAGSWQAAQTPRRATELNRPCPVVIPPFPSGEAPATLPPQHQFLELPAENLALMTLKQAEDSPDQWIIRCYETQGRPAPLQLTQTLGLGHARVVDGLERPLPTAMPDAIAPWQILSLCLPTDAQ